VASSGSKYLTKSPGDVKAIKLSEQARGWAASVELFLLASPKYLR
jgi:hypothetical protein